MHLTLFTFRHYLHLATMKRILLALDLDEPVEMTRAVEAMASQLGAQLFALHVMPPPDMVPFSGYEGMIGLEGLPYALYDPSLSAEREEAESNAFNRFLAERFAAPVHAALRQGDPAAVILDDADAHDADLIVLGHRHRSFMEKLFAGSVASAVLRESSRPTLFFPITDES